MTLQYPSPDRSAAIKWINRLGALAARLRLRLPALDADMLLRQAQRNTGLEDYGDRGFTEGLAVLLRALNTEADLSQIGRLGVKGQIVTELENRLRLIDYGKRHPVLFDQPVTRPIFVMGLPRTGTTILFELLAQDPALRAPLSWEVSRPLPPSTPATLFSDPRITEVDAVFANVEALAPGFQAIHAMGALLPQECVAMLAGEFKSEQFAVTCRLPSYREWLASTDMTPAYRWHKRFLQLMQQNHPPQQWVLKTPVHLMALDALHKVYPDAIFVQTHRDPVAVMGSVSSLACHLHGAFSDNIDPAQIGCEESEYFAQMLKRGMQLRDAFEDQESRFFDMPFSDIIRRPMDAIADMYVHFGMTLSARARSNMQAYLNSRSRDKHGVHKYSLADYGLSEASLRPQFAHYCERFNVETGIL